MLERARRLGDVLLVAVNDDSSVTRLKGVGRPVNRQLDRARVLQALESVSAVTVFAEDDPIEVVRAVRPDVFVKGGDYRVEELPEAAVVEGLGGQVVLLPYEIGRSTTRIIEKVRARA